MCPMMRARSARVIAERRSKASCAGGHGGVHGREQPEAALPAVVRVDRFRAVQPREDLLDHVANQFFVDLHGNSHPLDCF